MASPARDARNKAQQIWPGAEVDARLQGGIIHRHPTDPLHKMLDIQCSNTGWHFGEQPYTIANEVDTDWVDADPVLDDPFRKKMVLADYRAYFGNGNLLFNSGMPFRYVNPQTGDWLQWQPNPNVQWTNDDQSVSSIGSVKQAVEAQVDGDKLTFPGAYGAGIDFEVILSPIAFMKRLILQSALSPPPQFIIDGGNPALMYSVQFQRSSGVTIWVDGVEWNEGNGQQNAVQTFENVEFRNSSGESVFFLARPWVSEAGLREVSANAVTRIRRSGNSYFIEIRVPWSWLEGATYPVEIDPTVEPKVESSSDDAMEKVSDGTMYLTDNTIYARCHSNAAQRRILGARFQLNVPQASQIDVAYASFYITSDVVDDAHQEWDFQDVDSALTFSTSNYDISGRSLTGNPVLWNALALLEGWESTPSLVTPLQAVVDRSGFSSGSYVALIATPHATDSYGISVYSIDMMGGLEGVLHVEYSTGGAQNITNAGNIASLEAFGTLKVNLNIISVGGIASLEAFGEPTVFKEQFITDAGAITSEEAQGSPKLNLNVVEAGGIVSGEAHGPPQLNLNITQAGNISSSEAFGLPNVSVGGETQNITDAGGIASTESFGTALISVNITDAGGVTSGEAFESPQVDLNISAVGGVASAEAFDIPKLALNITDAGDIASLEAFGDSKLALNITDVGDIASLEAFGEAKLALNITEAGAIASAEALGEPTVYIEQFITDAGNIPTAETFGTPKVNINIAGAGAIASAEGFGAPQLNLNIVGVGAIGSAEAFGQPTVFEEQFIEDAGGIASAEAFGNPVVSTGETYIYPEGIPSAEAFGTAQLDLNITDAGSISSAEALGTPKLNLNVTGAGGIASAETFGEPQLDLNITGAGGIASAEVFGEPQLDLNIADVGDIASAEVFGTPALSLNVTGAGAIASAEAVGTPSLSLKIFPDSVASAEAFGTPYLLAVAHPDSDISLGNWTDEGEGTTDIYTSIDEAVVNDSDYVQTAISPTPTTLEVGLSNVNDPGIHEMHIVRYRYRKVDTGSATAKLTVYLMQSTTTIAYWVHNDIGTSWVDAEQTLSTGEAGSITDYTDLRLRFVAEEA